MSKLSIGTRDKPHCRYLTFSLRSVFVVLTASAVWLGVIVHRAREQRDAVKAIEALGGIVTYDWQLRILVVGRPEVLGRPSGPAWLRQIVGDDYFQNVREVRFGFAPRSEEDEPDVRNSIPHLQRTRTLKRVVLECSRSGAEYNMTKETLDALKAALPNCEVTISRF